MKNKTALLVLDLINEIVHPSGKYSSEGYFDQVTCRDVIHNAKKAIEHARRLEMLVIYVIVGFSENYVEWPKNSPVFRSAKTEKRIILGTWGTQIHSSIEPKPHEKIIVKNRINSFYQTNLELLLKNNDIQTVLLTGVSTEFVILSTAMQAHDKDYQVVVLEDATASSHEDLHISAIKILERIAKVNTVENFFREEIGVLCQN